MSHLASIGVKVTNIEAAKLACKELGGILVEAKTFRTYQHGATCNYKMTFTGIGYEVGLSGNAKTGYDVQLDTYGDGYGLIAKLGPKGEKFKQLYGVHATTLAAKAKGKLVQRVNNKDGSIHLKVSA